MAYTAWQRVRGIKHHNTNLGNKTKQQHRYENKCGAITVLFSYLLKTKIVTKKDKSLKDYKKKPAAASEITYLYN